MSLSISSWNTGQTLRQPELQGTSWESLKRSADTAHVLGLSEVLHPGLSEAQTEDVLGRLGDLAAALGHTMIDAQYEDDPKRSNEPEGFQQRLAMLVRDDLSAATQRIRLDSRNALVAHFSHSGVGVSAATAHFSDLGASIRKAQAEAYIGHVEQNYGLSDDDPYDKRIHILAGDSNYLPPGRRARLMRLASPAASGLVKLFGVAPEGPDMNESAGRRQQFERGLSVAYRASQMGKLGAHTILTNAGFRDADPFHEPTHPIGQIDRVLYRADGELQGLSVAYEVGDKGPSDHSPVTARFKV